LYGGRFAPGSGTQDQLIGNSRDNVIWGREGNDFLDGGSSGYDTLKEERAGNWNLATTSLVNATTGETDTFTASTFDEISLTGDASDNTLDASSFSGVVRLDGAGGTDTLIGGTDTNYLTGGAGSDIIDGSRGLEILTEGRDASFTLTSNSLIIGTELARALVGQPAQP
jgi:Ca2+-binding RTX toxin-like protein